MGGWVCGKERRQRGGGGGIFFWVWAFGGCFGGEEKTKNKEEKSKDQERAKIQKIRGKKNSIIFPPLSLLSLFSPALTSSPVTIFGAGGIGAGKKWSYFRPFSPLSSPNPPSPFLPPHDPPPPYPQPPIFPYHTFPFPIVPHLIALFPKLLCFPFHLFRPFFRHA